MAVLTIRAMVIKVGMAMIIVRVMMAVTSPCISLVCTPSIFNILWLASINAIKSMVEVTSH